MRILVLSDSHGNYPQVFKAHQRAGRIDQVVHLGDGTEDARLLGEVLEIPVIRVAGNCDFHSELPHERLVRLGGVDFFITHGNRYFVKSGLTLVSRRGLQVGAGVVLYGHTHRALVQRLDGVLLVNPGELQNGHGSYAIVTVEAGVARAELFSLD